MVCGKTPRDVEKRKLLGVTARNAVTALAEVARFLVNPGAIGKCEVGEKVQALLIFTEGELLPPNNELGNNLKRFLAKVAPRGVTNRTVLEELANCFRGKLWELPGMNRVITGQTGARRVREDLGTDFVRWGQQGACRNLEGLRVELNLSTDGARVREWHENFGLAALKGNTN